MLQGISKVLYSIDSKDQIKLWYKAYLHAETGQKRQFALHFFHLVISLHSQYKLLCNS